MIKHYLWNTPNGYKSAIALHEMGLPHENIWIDIGAGQQKTPEFMAIAPNARIPAIHDEETNVTVMESGAILQYLAEKSGQFGGATPAARAEINQWLHWQMSGVGPMMGQAFHYKPLADKHPYTWGRTMTEVYRLFDVLEGALAGREYIAGEFSIADMAIFPWVRVGKPLDGAIYDDRPNIAAWIDRVRRRDATRKALRLTP